MSRLALWLLSTPRVEIDGVPLEVDTRKAIALLAYLALNDAPQGRDQLAALLWPSYADPRARLRRTLSVLNSALGGAWLLVDRETIALRRTGDLFVDVAHFQQRLAECRRHHHPPEATCAACIPRLIEAVTLYRADFMAGFSLRDSEEFDAWQILQAELLRRELTVALERLTSGLAARADLAGAISYGLHWVALDPLHEPAHRRLIQLYAQAGQRAEALRQYQACAEVLRRELGLAPAPETSDLRLRVERGEIGGAPEARPPAPAAPAPALHSAIPRSPLPLIGRATELTTTLELLADPACRLLSLIGPGGVGKTRLALAAAEQVVAQWPDGVYVVSLAGVGEAAHLVAAIADRVGCRFYGKAEPLEQLAAYLGERQLLILLDNFEQVLDGAAIIPPLLQAAPRIKLLITSRERLNRYEEWLVALEGLAVPPEGAAAVEAYSAAQLFLASARRVQPGFSPAAAEQADLARICRLVEGLPLGIELAASWVRLLSCAEIAQELSQNVDGLASSLRDLPERHRSLKAVFDSSWRLLDPDERRMLARLAAFQGDFTRDAAAALTPGAAPPTLLRAMAQLADKSLLRRGGGGRFALHGLVRQYAAAQLRELGIEQETLARFCAYYAGLLGAQTVALRVERQPAALAALSAEIENLRAAWGRAIGQGLHAEIARCEEGLYLFYDLRSWFREGEASFAAALERLDQPDTPEALVGRLLARRGWFAYRLGDYEQANALLGRARAILQRCAPEADEHLATTLNHLGNVALYQGAMDAARDHYQAGLAIRRAIDDRPGIARTLTNLGNVAFATGDYAEAQRLHGESLAVGRTTGDRQGVALCLNNLGFVMSSLGDRRAALALHSEALEIATAIDDTFVMALSLINLGAIAYYEADHAAARRAFSQSLAHCRQIGDRRGVALSLYHLGLVASIRGEAAPAAQLLGEALAIYEAIGDRAGMVNALNELGELDCAQGQPDRARRRFIDAITIAMAAQTPPLALDALVGIALALAQAGERERAAELQALVLHHPQSDDEARRKAEQRRQDLASTLGPEAMAAAEARGHAMSLEAAVAAFIQPPLAGCGPSIPEKADAPATAASNTGPPTSSRKEHP